MEPEKYVVHNILRMKPIEVQISVEKELTVPEGKPEVEAVILKRGIANVQEVRVNAGKAEVNGDVSMQVLYSGREPDGLRGAERFTESFNLPAEYEDVRWNCDAKVEDVLVKILSPQKLVAKAVITLTLKGEKYDDVMLPCAWEEENNLQVLTQQLQFHELQVDESEMQKISKDFELSSQSPNISSIIWSNVSCVCTRAQMSDDGVQLDMRMELMVLYSDAKEGSINWYNKEAVFTKEIDFSGASQELIAHIDCRLQSADVEIRADYDGEDRIFGVDALMLIRIKAYRENEKTMIADAYIPSAATELVTSNTQMIDFASHNTSKCRVQGTVKGTGGEGRNAHVQSTHVLGCIGDVQIEDIDVEENRITVAGSIKVTVLYDDTDGDITVLSSVMGSVEFTHDLEMNGLEKYAPSDVSTAVHACIEHISADFNGDGSVEVKAMVTLDALAMAKRNIELIDRMEVKDCAEELRRQPQITGYIAKSRDTLWDIAKAHHTTIEDIKKCNQLSGDNIKRGERLILVKNCGC